LFPTTIEYRTAIENYLSEHAPHFIKTIGDNKWISFFEEKILTEVSEAEFLIIIIEKRV
jgi:hypothetical protein